MTIRDALREAYDVLGAAGIETPVLDATVLLADAAGVTKERLLAELPEELERGTYERFRARLRRRLEGVPVSYIRGLKEFWGLEFEVDRRVLVPRPETETLVEAALELIRGDSRILALHDACTGSGCVAIACKRDFPLLEVSVSDISPEALEVCRANSLRLLGEELPSVASDLLERVEGPFDVITANPPYLLSSEVSRMLESGWPEPPLALDGGGDGLELELRLLGQAPARLSGAGVLLLECAAQQASAVAAAMREQGFREVRSIRDLAGTPRVVCGRLRP